MASRGAIIGEYFEYAVAEELKKIYKITSSVNLSSKAQNLGLTKSEEQLKNSQAKNLASKLQNHISKEYLNKNPTNIEVVGPNPKIRKYFTNLNSSYDDNNPSDIILKFDKALEEKEYFGISLKSIGSGKKATVKANLGVTEFMELFGNPQGTVKAAEFLYDKLAKVVVQNRKSDVENNFSKYGLSKKPTNHYSNSRSAKWFNKNFVSTLKSGKKLFQSDAKTIKQNYVNYLEKNLKNVPQDKMKRFIVEKVLKEVSLPLYFIGKSNGSILKSFNTDKILSIFNSTIEIDTRTTPSGETRIKIKEKNSTGHIVQLRVKYSNQQDMTSSIKIEVT